MRKSLSKHGNSLALVIDKPILELLGITADTDLEITTDGSSLILTPAGPRAARGDVDRAMAAVNERYAEALRKLAE